MHQFSSLRDQIKVLLESVPEEQSQQILALIDRIVKSYEKLDAKFDRGIKDRAAIHALLKKTSEDLITQYRAIFEYAGTAMIVVEHDGTISLANSKFAELTGCPSSEIEGKRHLIGFFADSEQARIWHYHKGRRHSHPDIPIQYETKIRSLHDGLRDVAVSTGMFADTGQSIVAFLDITEHKQIITDLNRHRTNREALLSLYQLEGASLDEICTTTLKKALNLTGSKLGILTLVSKKYNFGDSCWAQGIDHENAPRVMGRLVYQVIENASPVIENDLNIPPDLDPKYGKSLNAVFVPVLEADQIVLVIGLAGSPTIYKNSDIEQLTLLGSTMWRIIVRKEQENAISLANKKLNLMNDITRHDILNAIARISGCADMAASSDNETERNDLLAEIKTGIKTVHTHVLFTRDYQKIGVNTPQWNDVKTLIASATAHFKNNRVTIENNIENLEVYADPMLMRVVYNLIDNAIRYGDKLKTIRFYSRIENDQLILFCEDDGVGVPPEMKEKIFERGVGKNTGLGLFLTREILGITSMTIKETGRSGFGARFEIVVPKGQFRQSSNNRCF